MPAATVGAVMAAGLTLLLCLRGITLFLSSMFEYYSRKTWRINGLHCVFAAVSFTAFLRRYCGVSSFMGRRSLSVRNVS